MAPLRILITGANGFIGRHLCKQLLELNHEVVALVHSGVSSELSLLKETKNLTIVRGDIKDSRFTAELFGQYPAHVVFHLAIAPSSHYDVKSGICMQDSEAFQTNFEGTLNILTSANQAGPVAWIQSSTMSVYNYETPDYIPVDEKHPTNPQDIYGFSKLLAEKACQYYSNYKVKVIILRYAGVYGIGKNGGLIAEFTKKCLENSNEPYTAAIGRTSDFISVKDVVTANILAMKKLLDTHTKNYNESFPKSNFNIYNIGSGKEISAFETTKLIRNLCGNESVNLEEGEGNLRRFFFDISLARKELGFSPKTIRQGLFEYVDNMKKMMVKSY